MEETFADLIENFLMEKYCDQFEEAGVNVEDIIPIILDKYEEQIIELQEELESALEAELP